MALHTQQEISDFFNDKFSTIDYLQELQADTSISKIIENLAQVEFYPELNKIFRSLELSPLSSLKIVIIGQDPYHGHSQASGLAFGVNENVKIPPSLRNILKEIKSDIGKTTTDQTLESLAAQGVLLLNNTLTVAPNQAGSHRNFGWEIVTDHIITKISSVKERVVFILWGQNAFLKTKLIDQNKHFIISSPHPSPLSAHRGFIGSKPFSKANNQLKKWQITPIIW